MEQRRFILFILLSSVVMLGWLNLAPILFPKQFAAPKPNPVAADDPDAGDEPADDPGDAAPAELNPAVADTTPDPTDAADDNVADIPQHPERKVVLGSLDLSSTYFLQVTLTSMGAAIESATLNDPRYTTADDRQKQLRVVGNDENASHRTLELTLKSPAVDLADVNWNVVQQSESQAVFEIEVGDLTLRRTYTLREGDPEKRDQDYEGYLVDVSLEIVNGGEAGQPVQYELQGPVGLPLENADNARTFIEARVGTSEDPGSPLRLTAQEVVEQYEEATEENDPSKIDRWRDPLKYIGVDVQYFTALLFPVDDQREDGDGDGKPDVYFSEAAPALIRENNDKPGHSDISVTMTSETFDVAAGDSLQQSFQLYLGPKRPELLEPLDADGTINFGWFGVISVGMVWLLEKFYFVLRSYGLSIVLLTLIVRACMFPITRKQAAGAKKMKELQPKLQELKTKYAKEPEKFWQAQRDLFRKHNYHPLAGCLPLVLQLPIFIGLYNALNNAVDLRMGQFLWIDNLAAPDALFSFGFALPLLGWTEFNLLPFITITLWIVQQKLFMPPATTEEQALQYKVMNFMMIFIGYMIYRVPAGLCVYFITSTLWGISERKALDYFKKDEKPGEAGGDSPEQKKTEPRGGDAADETPKSPGLFARLLAAADEARMPTGAGSQQSSTEDKPARRDNKRGGNKKRRKR